MCIVKVGVFGYFCLDPVGCLSSECSFMVNWRTFCADNCKGAGGGDCSPTDKSKSVSMFAVSLGSSNFLFDVES